MKLEQIIKDFLNRIDSSFKFEFIEWWDNGNIRYLLVGSDSTKEINQSFFFFDIERMKAVFRERMTCDKCGFSPDTMFDCITCKKGEYIPKWQYIMQQLLPLNNKERIEFIGRELEKLNQVT